jgi:GTP-binding protein
MEKAVAPPHGLSRVDVMTQESQAPVEVLNADFIISLPRWKPDQVECIPMVCFAGRSNVGKSSLLNTLCNRKQLARVSNTPGRTQAINVFQIELRQGEERRSLYFGDLPGYGYAKAPESVRKQWTPMMESVLQYNPMLRAVAVLLDIRHRPTQQDRDFIEMLEDFEVPMIPIATKRDKVPKTKQPKHLKDIENGTGIEREDIRLYSSVTKAGRGELLADIWDLAEGEVGI